MEVLQFQESKANYNDAKFSEIAIDPEYKDRIAEAEYFTGEGKITIPGGGYTIEDDNKQIGNVSAGTDMTCDLRMFSSLSVGNSSLEYKPFYNGKTIDVGGDAEDTLPGRTITWSFPEEYNMGGSKRVPNFKTTSQQLAQAAPYIELIKEGDSFRGLKFKLVRTSDPSRALQPAYKTELRYCIYFKNFPNSRSDFINISEHTWNEAETYNVTWDTLRPLSNLEKIRIDLSGSILALMLLMTTMTVRLKISELPAVAVVKSDLVYLDSRFCSERSS